MPTMTTPRMTAVPEHATLAQAAQQAVAYALVTLPMFALWELAHVRFYTIWVEGGPDAAWRAALHCTLGDAVIAFACVMATAILRGRSLGCVVPITPMQPSWRWVC